MKNKNISAYQKMFLVTPSVYQKLLNSIEEKDKVSIEQLNLKKDLKDSKTPSEKVLDKMSEKDIVQVEPNISSIQMETPPLTTSAQTEEILRPPPSITDTPETSAVTPINNVPEIYTNPLNEPCPQETDQGSIIPNLFYKPSIKNKTPKKLNKVMVPEEQSEVRELRSGKVTLFPCSVCGKKYTRNHDLKRHLDSKTAHKNFIVEKNLSVSEENQNSDNVMDESFEYWDKDNIDTPNKPKLLIPKLTLKKKPLGKPKNVKSNLTDSLQSAEEFQTWTV